MSPSYVCLAMLVLRKSGASNFTCSEFVIRDSAALQRELLINKKTFLNGFLIRHV